MSGRRPATPPGLRWWLAVTALVGSLAGAGVSSTHAGLSDAETSAAQTITAASCFVQPKGQGNSNGTRCQTQTGNPEPTQKPKSSDSTSTSSTAQVTTVQSEPSATPSATASPSS